MYSVKTQVVTDSVVAIDPSFSLCRHVFFFFNNIKMMYFNTFAENNNDTGACFRTENSCKKI